MIHEIDFIRDIEKHLDSDSLLLLDLDNTIIRATTFYGSEEWEIANTEKFVQEGIDHKLALEEAKVFWQKAQSEIEMELIDENFSHIMNKWKGILPIMGLTSRESDINLVTLKHLQKNSLTFTFHDISHSNIDFHSGILFCGDTPKGEALFQGLEFFEFKKKIKKIIFVDDKKHHLENVRSYCRKHDLEFVGFHFKNKSREDVINSYSHSAH